ncbi:MAG: hypothetical protein SNJ55_08615 [Chloroherpetonaceae bacterium]
MPRIFREEIFESKYRFLVARMQFARGEISFEDLRAHADALISTIKKRRDQQFGTSRRYRLKISAAELCADPF